MTGHSLVIQLLLWVYPMVLIESGFPIYQANGGKESVCHEEALTGYCTSFCFFILD
jgi:hypothetical protein